MTIYLLSRIAGLTTYFTESKLISESFDRRRQVVTWESIAQVNRCWARCRDRSTSDLRLRSAADRMDERLCQFICDHVIPMISRVTIRSISKRRTIDEYISFREMSLQLAHQRHSIGIRWTNSIRFRLTKMCYLKDVKEIVCASFINYFIFANSWSLYSVQIVRNYYSSNYCIYSALLCYCLNYHNELFHLQRKSTRLIINQLQNETNYIARATDVAAFYRLSSRLRRASRTRFCGQTTAVNICD